MGHSSHTAIPFDLEPGLLATIRALAAETEAHDPYLRGHAARVARLAVTLSESLRLPPSWNRTLYIAGYLHDIGKMWVGPEILARPDVLSDDEMDLVRRHPVIGAERVAELSVSDDVVSIVRHHHERFDGEGYPDGLSGNAIPFGARILLVADVFDALTATRPYRIAWPRTWALEYLRKTAGRLADPVVVQALCRLESGAPPRPVPQAAPFEPRLIPVSAT